MDNVMKARWFAAGAHGDQRYGDARYIKHLDFSQAVYRRNLCDPIWEELNQILGG